MKFIYLHSSVIHHLDGLFGPNIIIDQLPDGLLAQLVEHCTRIAEVMGSNPVRAWKFFQVLFQLLVQ